MKQNFDQAVVLGAGFCGSLLAIHLAKFFKKVTVIEKKSISAGNTAHFIQSHHVHLLNKRGKNLLEYLFPEIVTKMTLPNFHHFDFDKEVYWDGPLGKLSERKSDLGSLYFFDRKNLQKLLWEHLTAQTNIEIIQEANIESIRLDEDEELTNIQYNDLNLKAKYLFSCLGREYKNSHRYHVIKSKTKYRSCYVKAPFFATNPYKVLIYSTFGNLRKHGIVLLPVNRDYYLMTQVAQQFSCDPITFILESGFAQAAKLTDQMEVIGDVNQYAIKEGKQLKFSDNERKSKFHFILGDELISLNPIFAQGMCLSLESINVIDQMLKEENFTPHHFQNMMKPIVRNSWMLGTSEDKLLNANFIEKFFYKMAQKLTLIYLNKMKSNSFLYIQFLKVINLELPLRKLFSSQTLKELIK